MGKRLFVNKNYLVLIAGLVWILAGGLVMGIGAPLFIRLVPDYVWLPAGGAVVFLVFYFPVFVKTVRKHVVRIRANPGDRMPIWLFFDGRSYLIMLVMMTMGVALRTGKLVPEWFIAFFYSGLGLALFACGTRFVNAFCKKRVLERGESLEEAATADRPG